MPASPWWDTILNAEQPRHVSTHIYIAHPISNIDTISNHQVETHNIWLFPDMNSSYVRAVSTPNSNAYSQGAHRKWPMTHPSSPITYVEHNSQVNKLENAHLIPFEGKARSTLPTRKHKQQPSLLSPAERRLLRLQCSLPHIPAVSPRGPELAQMSPTW